MPINKSNGQNDTSPVQFADIVGDDGVAVWETPTHAAGPEGTLPFTAEMLVDRPSGDIFGFSQNAGMGWRPSELLRKQFLILSTTGGLRSPDGSPIALGFHTGHWELSELVRSAAEELKSLRSVPFAAFCSDPCDGRTQGTPGMFDSLPYRNDAAQVMRRQARSLPTARGVMGVATCDKGLPAMMMALAGLRNLPVVAVPGGVTLAPERGRGRRSDTVDRRKIRAGRDHARIRPGRGLPGMRKPWGRLPVPRHGRHVAGHSRGPRAGHDHAAAVAVGHGDMAGRGKTIGESSGGAGTVRREVGRHPVPRRVGKRHGASRCMRRIDEPVAAPAGHRPRRGPHSDARGGLGGGQQAGPEASRCPAQRAGRLSHVGALRGRRRARGDVAPARPGPSRHRRDDRYRPDVGRQS